MPQQAAESAQDRVQVNRTILTRTRKKTKPQDVAIQNPAIQWQWGSQLSSQTPEI